MGLPLVPESNVAAENKPAFQRYKIYYREAETSLLFGQSLFGGLTWNSDIDSAQRTDHKLSQSFIYFQLMVSVFTFTRKGKIRNYYTLKYCIHISM